MKLLTYAFFTLLAHSTNAYPGMHKLLESLHAKLETRQDAGGQDTPDQFDSNEMIGDLRPSFNGGTGGVTSPTGQNVSDIITGKADPESTTLYNGDPPKAGSAKCKADQCCIWRWIALDMEAKFRGKSGRCTGAARAAIRLGFHDAGTWSKFTDDYGGADGSIILSGLKGNEAELSRAENRGLQNIADITTTWYNKYSKYGVGMADLIQMGANVATVVCPLGPRVRSWVGRIDSAKPAVNGLLPDVFAEADALIQLFEDKTISPHGLAALVGAHTTSQQAFVNTSRAGDPQDSSPGVWDVRFYNETTGTAPKRVFKFPSDVKLSQHPSISQEWSKFTNDQSHWNEVCCPRY